MENLKSKLSNLHGLIVAPDLETEELTEKY